MNKMADSAKLVPIERAHGSLHGSTVTDSTARAAAFGCTVVLGSLWGEFLRLKYTKGSKTLTQ